MRDLGAAFGRLAPDGAVILLEGELGAGKTTFAQGVGLGCRVAGPIASPTFNLILEYDGRRHFTHVDLYRLNMASDLDTLDIDAVLSGDGITCVEWPTLIAGRVASPVATLKFHVDSGKPDVRQVDMSFDGEGWSGLMDWIGGQTTSSGCPPPAHRWSRATSRTTLCVS
jgi:tRNA threonylcarbamoyladenosine biosynthesis protein TsaE